MKNYQYQTLVISDRGHLDDPEFLAAMNEQGVAVPNVPCPMCGRAGHAFANGWKHKEDAPKGGNQLCVLMERELEFDCPNVPKSAPQRVVVG